MKKGISPAIAVILLTFISVGMISMAYFWFQSAAKDTIGNVENSTPEKDIGTIVRFEHIDGSSKIVVVRNLGEKIVQTSKILIFINNQTLSGGNWSTGNIVPGDTAVFSWISPSCPPSAQVKLAAPQNFDYGAC